MLIFSKVKLNERITIGDITIEVDKVKGQYVKFAIQAPKQTPVKPVKDKHDKSNE